MEEAFTLSIIAHYRSDFATKFGVPRQSGIVPEQRGYIVFEREYRDRNALRGIDGYSHLWLLWGFSMTKRQTRFAPMVKPPRLGGNTRMGVFATRSPNRPNPIGLSSVGFLGTEERADCGTVLLVSGADLADGTPIYDIKPYLAFTDSHPDARGGFAEERFGEKLRVMCDEMLLNRIPAEKHEALLASLRQDPRPAYQHDPELPYGFAYAGYEIRFIVKDDELTVTDILPAENAVHVK